MSYPALEERLKFAPCANSPTNGFMMELKGSKKGKESKKGKKTFLPFLLFLSFLFPLGLYLPSQL
jgi:hypothetical protein